jgi:hypothetical protein
MSNMNTMHLFKDEYKKIILDILHEMCEEEIVKYMLDTTQSATPTRTITHAACMIKNEKKPKLVVFSTKLEPKDFEGEVVACLDKSGCEHLSKTFREKMSCKMGYLESYAILDNII